MGKKARPWVFLCHKFETGNEKHNVTVQSKKGKSSTKSFTRLPDAKRYAANRSRSLKLKTYMADLPKGGHQDIRVSKKARKKPSKRKRKDPFSLF